MSTDNNPKARLGDLKAPLHMLPLAGMEAIARVMQSGAAKYGAYNWREEAISATTYQAAFLRHLFAWFRGEDIDPDSGQHHFAHLGANALMLLDAMDCGQLNDDRPKPGPVDCDYEVN